MARQTLRTETRNHLEEQTGDENGERVAPWFTPINSGFQSDLNFPSTSLKEESTVPIYMSYTDSDGNAIEGDVTAEGHEQWVELTSFQWGVGRYIFSPTGASAKPESTAPSLSEIICTKDTDAATPKLLNEAFQGEGSDCTIDFCKTDKGSLEVYLSYTLENCMISVYTISGIGDRPMESLSLYFTKVECKNTGMGAANETGSPESVTYDRALAKVV
jgi:type VI secretion system secreted protein Hcp